jgi:hypothetical protein
VAVRRPGDSREEADMGNKDKGATKASKKKATASLKEKRQVKRTKKAMTDTSTMPMPK